MVQCSDLRRRKDQPTILTFRVFFLQLWIFMVCKSHEDYIFMTEDLTREELFLLVWERPARDIARELGISDVALGKRCKKLQVPKPPPGYWAKVKAGKRPRKPILKEFSEQLIERQNARAKQQRARQGWIDLSPLQAEIFQWAVDELSAAGIDLGEMELTPSGVRLVDGDVATQALLLIQKRHVKWLEFRKSLSVSLSGHISTHSPHCHSSSALNNASGVSE